MVVAAVGPGEAHGSADVVLLFNLLYGGDPKRFYGKRAVFLLRVGELVSFTGVATFQLSVVPTCRPDRDLKTLADG